MSIGFETLLPCVIWASDWILDTNTSRKVSRVNYKKNANEEFTPTGEDFAFSKNGKYLAVNIASKNIKIIDFKKNIELFSIETKDNNIYDIALSPDGKYLAAIGENYSKLWLWNPKELVNQACNRIPESTQDINFFPYLSNEIDQEDICNKFQSAKNNTFNNFKKYLKKLY